MSPLLYLPLTPLFFLILVGLLVFVVVVVEVRILGYAYARIGLGRGGAIFVLLGSLIGSYVNIPVAELPERQIVAGQVVTFFGMQYVVPVVVAAHGTILAVNVGGAIIPTVVSLYLLARQRLWVLGAVTVGIVAAIVHRLAHPVPGLGIALPVFVPALSTAVVALLLSRRQAAPLAYVGGSLGTLIGADLLNLDKVAGLGAPVAAIGGAGTFDGIFVTGIIAVLIASFTGGSRPDRRAAGR